MSLPVAYFFTTLDWVILTVLCLLCHAAIMVSCGAFKCLRPHSSPPVAGVLSAPPALPVAGGIHGN